MAGAHGWVDGSRPEGPEDGVDGAGCQRLSLHERFTANEAREFHMCLRRTRRLLTKMVLPCLAKDRDDLQLRGILAQFEGLNTQVLEQLDAEDRRDAAVRPKVQALLDLLQEGLRPR